MTDKMLRPNPEQIEAGRKVREGWADEMRPRRSTLSEMLLGERPVVEVVQGIYKVTWDRPCYILMEFDYLANHRSSGDVTAELTVLVNSDVGKGLYQKTRLNLLAARSVSAYASELDKRLPDLKIPWAKYLNDAVQWVLSEYRNGEPGIYLDEVKDEEVQAASPLSPFLAVDGPTILFGDGEATKSYLALALGASLQTGQEVIPGLIPPEPMRVGYLDWEWKPGRHASRLRNLWVGQSGALPRIYYMKCSKPITDERDRIRRAIRDEGLQFLIVDSAGYACSGAPEEAEIALAFFRTLEQLGLPCLITAHITKSDNKAATEKPFGSVFWHNSARLTLFIKRAEEESGGVVSVGLFQRKNSEGDKHPPFGLRWHFDEVQTTIERSTSALEEPGLESQLSVPKRIAMLLRGGPMTIHAIVEELDVPVETVRKSLQRGAGKHFVNFPGRSGQPATWANAAHDA